MKYILYTGILVILSFYFFPFEFVALAGFNTKMIMAGVGLAVAGIQLAKSRKPEISKDFMSVITLAALTSLIGLVASAWNNTSDYTYATYIVSMFVWLSAANVVVTLMKSAHKQFSMETLCNYLIVLCVAQCIIALLIDELPAVKDFVGSFLAGEGFMGKNKTRMYGIGCSLDVAGSRFSIILIMIVEMLRRSAKRYGGRHESLKMVLYIVAYLFIALVGNMMARTTTIGMAVSLGYLLFITFSPAIKDKGNLSRLWSVLGICIGVVVAIAIYLYNTDLHVQNNIRFAFEGFFSLVEKGRWEVHSNEILESMVVFPDNLKTWIIGDGYFDNPYDSEPYYTGKSFAGFYMQTDIGYLRFIFYFGVIGLAVFLAYFFFVAKMCIGKHPEYKMMIIAILCLNLIIWLKVSSDIFLVLALLMMMPEEKDQSEDITSQEQA